MQRPTSVTVFGILNIAFTLAGVGGIINFFNQASTDNPILKYPVMEIMFKNPDFIAWMKISSVLGGIGSIVLLAAGVGLLRFKEWGRKLSIVWGTYGIIAGIAGIVANFVFLTRPILQDPALRQGPEAPITIAVVFSATIGSVASLIYPTLLLVFMTRSKMKAAFRPAAPPPLPKI